MECRGSGMTDRAWGEARGILVSSFYNVVKRLRRNLDVTAGFMLADISGADAIYIVTGYTDMRKSIDGLCAIIQEQFSQEENANALYLFCGRKCDRIKAILKEPDGIVMIYKRLVAKGRHRWRGDRSEVRNLSWREFDRLMSGIDIGQPKAIKIPPGCG